MESLSSMLFSVINSPKDIAIFLGIILALLVFGLLSYIYLAIVFFSIGKRCKVGFPRFALIPLFGPAIIAYRASRMHWWPWLLIPISITGLWVITFLENNLILISITLISFILFVFYSIKWHYKMFRVLKKSGYLSLSILFPPLYFVIVGLALRRPINNINKNMKGG